MADVTTDVLQAYGHTMDQLDRLTGIHRSSAVRMSDDRRARMQNATYHTCCMKRYYGQLMHAINRRVEKAEPLCWNYLQALHLWARRREILDLITLQLISASDPRSAFSPGTQTVLL